MLGVCAIVEPRKHKALRFVVANVRDVIPDWPIYVFHGTENEDWAKSELAGIANISFFRLNVDNLSIAQYNQVLCSSVFYSFLESEYVLIFQTDCMLMHNHKIDDFLGYDYIGAVWDWKATHRIGNGGLSLRRVSAMKRVCEGFDFDQHTNEDVYFSQQDLNFPPEELAQAFSVESSFHRAPFGIHKPWVFMSVETIRRICTRVDELIALQS
jgi:hypothetical protein